jgi:lipooligosaccharide transport system permease protein
VGLVIMPMFLFGSTFFPISKFPAAVQAVIVVLPLYHATAMLRQLTTGAVSASIVVHIAYMVLIGVAAFIIAMRRLERALIR